MQNIINDYLSKSGHQNIINNFNHNYLSHPNYPSLLAISDSLNILEIENISANVPFQHLDKLPNRFLTKLNHINDFILLKKVNNVFYIESKKSKSAFISISDIENNWNGLVFILEENETKLKNSTFNLSKNWLLWSLLVIGFFILKNDFTFQKIFYLFTTTAGLYISYEILKTYFKKNPNESKFCSTSNEFSCNSVINSKEFKISKYVEFVDLPIVFFSISLFGILFNLFATNYIGFLSLLSTPVIIYSIYLQKTKINKWCPLCLIVSAILLLNSIVFCVFLNLEFISTEFLNLIIVSLIIIPIWFLLKDNITNNLDTTINNNKLLRFKRSEKVYNAVTEDIDSLEKIDFITIGNINSNNHLTLFVTPSCSFCHLAIKDALQLIEKHENSIYLKIGYNLNINNAENPYIKIAKIITNLFNNKSDYLQALKDWHIKKLELNAWLEKWDSNANLIFENEVLEKQFIWCVNQNFNYAPIRILNNKLLSAEYEISELHYFFKE